MIRQLHSKVGRRATEFTFWWNVYAESLRGKDWRWMPTAWCCSGHLTSITRVYESLGFSVMKRMQSMQVDM